MTEIKRTCGTCEHSGHTICLYPLPMAVKVLSTRISHDDDATNCFLYKLKPCYEVYLNERKSLRNS